MKFAVYAIAGNEKTNAERFMRAVNEVGWPCYVLCHSTDGTAEILRKFGAVVDETPMADFEFHRGKNYAMGMLNYNLGLAIKEGEYAVNLDLDERLHPEAATILADIEPGVTQVRHLYKPDGEIDRVREDYRVHARHAYTWALSIHERLEYIGEGSEKIQAIEQVLITQWPSKERRHTWAERLLKAVEKNPTEPRLRMLAGRDLYFDARYEEALVQFKYFVTHPADLFDASYVMTMMARCHKKLGDRENELTMLMMAERTYQRRESVVELAHAFLLRENYQSAFDAAQKAMTITVGQYAAHNDPGAWSFKPYEIAMHAAYNLTLLPLAVSFGLKALDAAKAEPDRRRIAANLKQMGAL